MERSQLNKHFLDYILDELMPWHHDANMRDFRLLEVNWYLHEFARGCVWFKVICRMMSY